MGGCGHINTARHDCLPKKTKVTRYWLQKDYQKDGELHLYKWVGECIAMHLKEGQPLASQ